MITDDEEARQRERDKVLKDGEHARFSMMLMDAKSTPASATLFDAAGAPRQLYDANTGAAISINEALVTAIVAEAAKLGMSVADYLKNVVRYAFHAVQIGAGHLDPTQKEEEA